MNFTVEKTLPKGNLKTSSAVIQTQWEVPDEKTRNKTLKRIDKVFKKYGSTHHSARGMKSYSCFLNTDGKRITHFSQWKDKAAIDYYQANDPEERQKELLAGLDIKRTWGNIYFPYKTYTGQGKLSDTGLIVFVKQYFKQKGQAEEFLDLVGEKAHQIDGLITNTFYINAEKDEFLNYALWKDERLYDSFLKHNDSQTKKEWSEVVANYEGRIKSKGTLLRHKDFVRIY